MNTIINPITVIAAALKGVQYAADFHRISNPSTPEHLSAAWESLSLYDHSRISQLVNEDRKPTSKQLATLLADTDTYEQLTEIKADFGHEACRQAWKLLPPEVRDRLSALCPNQKQPPKKKPASAKTQPSQNTLWEKTAAIVELEEAVSEAMPKALASVDDEDKDEEAKEAKRQELFEQWLCGLVLRARGGGH